MARSSASICETAARNVTSAPTQFDRTYCVTAIHSPDTLRRSVGRLLVAGSIGRGIAVSKIKPASCARNSVVWKLEPDVRRGYYVLAVPFACARYAIICTLDHQAAGDS
jgi:hypothetical protein